MTPNVKTLMKALPLKSTITAGCLAISLVALPLLSPVVGSNPDAMAAGDYSSTPAESALMKAAKKDIKNNNYQSAFDRLMAGIGAEANNADFHNLLGFSARKTGRYELSEKHYTKALSLNPKHKQAMEYMGELYLTLGQIDQAEALRERLDKVCWLGCSELDDLDKAIQAWKSKNQS